MKKLSIIILLLSAGAVYAGELPEDLTDAICNWNLDKVKSLVKAESSAEIKGNALNLACFCYGGNEPAAEYLLDIGADPDVFDVDEYAHSSLMWALHSDMKKTALRIAEKTKNVKFAQMGTKETAMHWAASAGDYEIIKILLKKGADPKAKTSGYAGTRPATPADFARESGHMEIALKLEGKNPATYRTTLHYFAKKGDTAKIKEMIQKGANVNEEEKGSQFTPLFYAAFYNHLDAVKVLLEAGANPNKVYNSGATALRESIVQGFDRVARVLIDAGATADHPQTEGCGGGMNEFNWTVEMSKYKLAKYILEKKAVNQSTSRLFYQRGRKEDIELAELMLKNGLLPSQSDIDDIKEYKKNGYEEDAGTLDKLLAMYEKALEGRPAATMKSMKMNAPRKKISESSKKKLYVSKAYEDDDSKSRKMSKSLKRIRTE